MYNFFVLEICKRCNPITTKEVELKEIIKYKENQEISIFTNIKDIHLDSYNLNETEILHYIGVLKDKLDRSAPFDAEFDEYYSAAFVAVSESRIIMKGDYWGVFRYYIFESEDRTIICNDIFWLQRIIRAKINKNALYDHLFFQYIRGNKTWIEGVKKLGQNQSVFYDFKLKKLQYQRENDFKDLFNIKEEINIEDTYDKFFSRFQKVNGVLSLSAGSDSRTVLACMLKHKIETAYFSWGDDNYLERFRINQLASRLGIHVKYIEFNDIFSDYENNYLDGVKLSDGMIPAPHFYHFYTKLPKYNFIFSGYLGSEFVKAELSDGMVSRPYLDIVKNEKELDIVIKSHFGGLKDDYRKGLMDYISKTYRNELVPVNTKETYKQFVQIMFKNLIPNKFAGIFILISKMNSDLCIPFLDLNILKSSFASGFGITIDNSIFTKDPFYKINCIKPQALAVRNCSKYLYRSCLDRDFSFKNSLESSLIITRVLKKYRVFLKKTRQKKMFSGQVSYEKFLHNQKNLNLRESKIINPERAKSMLLNYYVSGTLNLYHSISRIIEN